MPPVPHTEATAQRAVLQHTLIGLGLFQAADALSFMTQVHTGLRRDGVTPEWHHPISVALHLLTLKDAFPADERDDLFTMALLHDTLEDCRDVTREHLAARITPHALHGVILLSKTEAAAPERRRDFATYCRELDGHPLTCPVKLADRNRNFDSMVGVFTPEKQLAYVEEAETHLLPMSRRCRDRYTRLYLPIMNLHQGLKSQIHLIRAIHGNRRAPEPR